MNTTVRKKSIVIEIDDFSKLREKGIDLLKDTLLSEELKHDALFVMWHDYFHEKYEMTPKQKKAKGEKILDTFEKKLKEAICECECKDKKYFTMDCVNCKTIARQVAELRKLLKEKAMNLWMINKRGKNQAYETKAIYIEDI